MAFYLACHMLNYPLPWTCREFLVLQSQVTVLYTGIKYPDTHNLIIQTCHITLNGIMLEIVREHSIHAIAHASQEET